MSLHDIFMDRAALENPEFRASYGQGPESTNLSSLVGLAANTYLRAKDSIDEERNAENERRRIAANVANSMKQIKDLSDSQRLKDAETTYTMGKDGILDMSVKIKDKDDNLLSSLKTKADLANKLAIADPMFAGRLAKEVAEEYDYIVSGIQGAQEVISGPMQSATIPTNTPIRSAGDLPLETTIAMPKAPGAGMEYGPAVQGRMEGIKAVEKEKPAAKAKLEETAASMDRFFADTNRAYNELESKAPTAGSSTLGGAVARATTVPFKKWTGQLSNTKAMADRISKFVYPMAKSYDPGGRLAKDDIQAFANVLGMVGSEATTDIAVKGALELRDLVETMNKKGADGDAFIADFLNKAESEGGMYKLMADEYKTLSPANKRIDDSMMDDDAAYQEYRKMIGE
jgi:hypothetical protein